MNPLDPHAITKNRKMKFQKKKTETQLNCQAITKNRKMKIKKKN